VKFAALQSPRVAVAAIAISSLFFAGKLFWFIDRYAVNVLFWDEYDFLRALRVHATPWELFSWIHGPHRMGLGFFFIGPVFALSRWDSRAEAFATGGLFLVILALTLFLKRRAVGRFSVCDACIPALVLTTAQFEAFIGTPNPAHGPIPLLLVVVAPLCWLVGSGPLRALLAGVVALAAAFTGFALFLVPLLAALFLVDAIQPERVEPWSRSWDAVAAVLSAGALILFFLNYRFSSAVSCFRFPDPHPLEYAPFAGLVALRPMRLFRLVPGAGLLGLIGLAFALAVLALGAILVVRRPRTLLGRAIFLFSGFTLLFAVETAVGRICLGQGMALSSRYVSYAIPLWLAAYLALHWLVEKRPRLGWILVVFAVSVVAVQGVVRDDRGLIRWYSEGKARWRACYLDTGDETACNRFTNFRVYPVDDAAQVVEMRQFLRQNRLNLFKP
jgi:hypothetical protein